jgi:hypothetical protein
MCLMAHKLQEFLHLHQGTGSVYEHNKRFSEQEDLTLFWATKVWYLNKSIYEHNKSLSVWSYHADTDEMKMALFHQGLNSRLHEHLTLFHDCTFNELVSASFEQEDACRADMKEKRKMPFSGASGGAPPSTTWSTLHR